MVNKSLHVATALKRSDALQRLVTDEHSIYVDSADCAPESMEKYKHFNPFHFNSSVLIPVPGMPKYYSHSVESIWQGLKLVAGETDLTMFKLKATKRPPENERTALHHYNYEDSCFNFRDVTLSLIEARYLIYLNAYLFLLELPASKQVIEDITKSIIAGKHIYFYDWDENFDIHDTSCAFSHSAILAAWFNGTLEHDFLSELRRLEDVFNVTPQVDISRYYEVKRLIKEGR